jgi:hypothetical protein
LLVLDKLKTEKSRVRDRFISYSKYSGRGTLFIQKKVGSALTETENWDLLVDCTSRDGRHMLDAGVHLSDKRTLLMKTHIPFQTQYKIFYRDFPYTLKAGIFSLKRFSLLSLKSVFDFFHYTQAVEDKAR